MSQQHVWDAMRLLSFMSQAEISSALRGIPLFEVSWFGAAGPPAPPISPRPFARLASDLDSPGIQMQRLFMQDPFEPSKPAFNIFEELYAEPNSGRRFLKAHPHEPRLNDAWLKSTDNMWKAIEKNGTRKTGPRKSVNTVLNGQVMRVAIKTAVFNGVWQSAAITAAFDIKMIFDGDFKEYLIKTGVSGICGETISGLSSWIDHPFFSNGMVLGVIVGSAFGALGEGARVGGMLGSFAGPIGTTVGTAVGTIAAGYFGRRVALNIPGLGGKTEHEVQMMYKAIKEGLAGAGLEPDPSLSPTEVVTAWIRKNIDQGGIPFPVQITQSMAANVFNLHDALHTMQSTSPERFASFLNALREANKR